MVHTYMQSYVTYALPLFTHFVWHKHITKDMKQPFVKPWPANRPLATPRYPHASAGTHNTPPLSSILMHVYTTSRSKQWAYAYICPLMSSRAGKQASLLLSLPAAFDKAPRTQQQAQTHAPMSPPSPFVLASFVPGSTVVLSLTILYS
jgi:hypothetical protein